MGLALSGHLTKINTYTIEHKGETLELSIKRKVSKRGQYVALFTGDAFKITRHKAEPNPECRLRNNLIANTAKEMWDEQNNLSIDVTEFDGNN